MVNVATLRSPSPIALPQQSTSRSFGLFQSLLVVAFCISFFVLVEPAPVDGLILGLFGIGVLCSIVRLDRLPMLPVVLLTGLAVANVISMVNAADETRAMFYAFVTFYMIISWALFVGVVDFFGSAILTRMFQGYCIAVVLAVIPSVASYFHLIGFHSLLMLSGRPKGLFKDPNVFGPFVVLIAVMAATGSLPIAKRWIQVVMAVIAAMGVVFSYSRACWINFAVSLVTFAVLDQLLPLRSPEVRSTSLIQLCAFGFLLIAAVGLLIQIPSVKAMLETRMGQGGMHDYDQIRFQTQEMAVRAAIDRPLGIGPGQSEGTFTYATHSSYVRVLGENGLFGLFCFVGFLIASLVQAIVRATKALTRRQRSIYLAAAACICGHLINSGVVDTVHWRHFWFLLALPWMQLDHFRLRRA